MPSLTVLLRPEDVPDAAAIQEQVRLIQALPVVRTLSQLPGTAKTRAGFQAFLWCHAGREHGGCGKKMEAAVQLTSTRTTLLACLQELHAHLLTRHTGCLAAAEAGRAAAAAATSEPAPPPAATEGMLLMQVARERSAQLEAAELAAIAACKASDEEIAAIERKYFPKKQRADEEPATHFSEWTPRTWLREETRVRGRRALALGTYQNASAPRTGKTGYLEHARHGLIGCVLYWAGGVLRIATAMVLLLIKRLGLTERVRTALYSKELRYAETEHAICDLLEQVTHAHTHTCKQEEVERGMGERERDICKIGATQSLYDRYEIVTWSLRKRYIIVT